MTKLKKTKTPSSKKKSKRGAGLLKGFKNEEHRNNFIKSLKHRDSTELIRESVEALVLNGMNYDKSARELGITTGSLRNRCTNHPEIMLSIRRTPDVARTLLEASSKKASNTVIDLLDSDNERIRLDSSKEVLDRVGVIRPDVNTAVQVNVFNKIKEDVDSFDV